MLGETSEETNGHSKKKRLPIAPPDAADELEDWTVELVALDRIYESPSNPRKTFDPKKLAELAEDIRRRGKLLQPVLGRRNPCKLGEIELIFGARRFRASKLAGRTTIPMRIREHTDEEVLEIQIVENVNREDVHPLEEADGLQQLHEKHGIPVEELAAKTGKAPGTVRQRLKLTTLGPEARKAYFAGQLTNATALLVARIPDRDLQKQAVKDIAGRSSHGDGPATLHDASWIVERDYMLRLSEAPFDLANEALVPAAGGCPKCPKNSTNQRELFGAKGASTGMCTDKRCFKLKVDADWEKKKAKAEAEGLEVLGAKETKQIFSQGRLLSNAGYIDLKESDYSRSGSPTYKSQLKGKDVPVVIARDDAGRTHELVKKSAFAKAVPQSKPSTDKKRREKREREKRLAELGAVALGESAAKKQATDAFWRTLALATLEWSGAGGNEKLLCTWVGKETVPKGGLMAVEKALEQRVAKLTPERARGFAVLLLSLGYHGEKARKRFEALYGKPEVKLPTKEAPPPKAKASAKPAVDMTKPAAKVAKKGGRR